MNTIIKGTCGKTREYVEKNQLPNIGDDWIGSGYEDAIVTAVDCVNDEVADTSSGDPKEFNDFYRITVKMDGEEFQEYITVQGGWNCENYDDQ